jgi:hypothetical protein
VELLVVIISPNGVVSPVTGARAAILHMELEEQLTDEEPRRRLGRPKAGARVSLGDVVYGDLITCRDEDGAELSFVASRARFRFDETRRERRSIAAVPPALARSLGNPHGGALSYREHAVLEGDRLLVQAIVEPTRNAITLGYRSVPRFAFITREDLAPVFLMSPRA